LRKFDLSLQAIALTDLNSGRFMEVNDKFCETTKFKREEVVGRTPVECGFYSGGKRREFIKELRISGEVHEFEMDYTARDGSVVNMLMFSRLVPISRKPFVFTVFMDMTEYKNLEVRFQRAQKMEAIGTLAGGIAFH